MKAMKKKSSLIEILRWFVSARRASDFATSTSHAGFLRLVTHPMLIAKNYIHLLND